MNNPILRRMHACVLARVPVALWGAPGTGKTTMVRSYGRATGRHVERWILSRCEPIDIKPRVYRGDAVMTCDPPEIVRVNESRGLMFCDELNRASRETEGAMLDRFDSANDGVSIVVACNPPSRGQAARPLDSATANRFAHFDVHADAIAFASAQIGGWQDDSASYPAPDSAALDAANARASAYVSAFIRANPAAIEAEPNNPVQAGRAWPSPRSWESTRRAHAVAMALKLDADDTMAIVGGIIGEAFGTQYLSFVSDADLPDPEKLLANPAQWELEIGRVDRTIVALTAVAAVVERDLTEKRWQAAFALIQRCEKADQADAAVVGSDLLAAVHKRAVVKDPSIKISHLAIMLAKYAPRVAKIIAGGK